MMLIAVGISFVMVGLVLVLTSAGPGGYGPPTSAVFDLGVLVFIMGFILSALATMGTKGEREAAIA